MAADSSAAGTSSLAGGLLLALRSLSIPITVPGTANSSSPGTCHLGKDSPTQLGAALSHMSSLISSSTFSLVSAAGVDIHRPSPITAHLPFVSSPTPVILSVLIYLAAVALWSRHIRSSGLKPYASDPPALRWLVLAHNVFLCGLSFFMGAGVLSAAWRYGYSIWGNPFRDNEPNVAFYVYIFYLSKVYEFADTAIMLLKRNLRQVSYLHVYHHATIAIVWWIMCYRCPGGDSYFSVAFNSWVHVLMYSYYLLAAFIGKDEKKRKKYLFWGKYLTVLQMVQFVSFIGQSVYGMLHPGVHPRGIDTFLFVYSLSLLLFFLDFFVKKHVRGSRREAAAQESAGQRKLSAKEE